ncbi:hypothetical protein PGTUg99_035204 [Puccinia graminis f. sp. tritici]|uniref:Uncharacterized protein n=1 Tax=Puccinia graminis f. sp. tritici TaxID=56615 RepID=A0A5B0P447_PUCGR|nr:hypothetical protein PGTUg99_035204 [Puccinia graminis f. sp. tritici]
MRCSNLVDEGGFLLAAEVVQSLQRAGSSSRSSRLQNLAHWGELALLLDRVVPRRRPACFLLGPPLGAACSADPLMFLISLILLSTPLHRVLWLPHFLEGA